MICRTYIGKSLRLKRWLLFGFVWGWRVVLCHGQRISCNTFVETGDSAYVQVVDEQALSKVTVVRFEDGRGLRFEPTHQHV
jgi:hypothetical protein